MMKPMTWLLAGAALTLCGGAAAFAETQAADAVRQAQEDSSSAARPLGKDQMRRDLRVYRNDGKDEVRVWRHSDDGDRDIVFYPGPDRAESLTAMLQLRPDQQPALKAFLEATRPDHEHAPDHMLRFDRDGEGKTTLQRLDEMQAKMAEQQAEANRRIAAIKAFYGQLDERQKKAFDSLPMLMVVGPSIGPMMLPHPMPIVRRAPVPPVPPVPPAPPEPPRS